MWGLCVVCGERGRGEVAGVPWVGAEGAWEEAAGLGAWCAGRVAEGLCAVARPLCCLLWLRAGRGAGERCGARERV